MGRWMVMLLMKGQGALIISIKGDKYKEDDSLTLGSPPVALCC